MSDLLDTSVIVRYIIGTPTDRACACARIIDGEDELVVTELVIAEAAYVLSSVYGVPRATVVDSLMTLLRRVNIATFCLHKDRVLTALLLCRSSGRVSFADALIWAAARSEPGSRVYSLDERFPSEGIEVVRPGAPQ